MSKVMKCDICGKEIGLHDPGESAHYVKLKHPQQIIPSGRYDICETCWKNMIEWIREQLSKGE